MLFASLPLFLLVFFKAVLGSNPKSSGQNSPPQLPYEREKIPVCTAIGACNLAVRWTGDVVFADSSWSSSVWIFFL